MANNISILASGTFIRGDLFSDDLLILEGGVEGNVVGNRVLIKANGWVHGELACRSLAIELGGMMNGRIRVSEKPTQAFLAWSQEKDEITSDDDPVALAAQIKEE
jgi:cytoskeletal protein CcmA (bactofilin family)